MGQCIANVMQIGIQAGGSVLLMLRIKMGERMTNVMHGGKSGYLL